MNISIKGKLLCNFYLSRKIFCEKGHWFDFWFISIPSLVRGKEKDISLSILVMTVNQFKNKDGRCILSN